MVREIAADGQLVCLQAPIAPERVASGDEEEKKAELEELFSADNIEQLRNLVTHKSNEDKIQQYIDIEVYGRGAGGGAMDTLTFSKERPPPPNLSACILMYGCVIYCIGRQ